MCGLTAPSGVRSCKLTESQGEPGIWESGITSVSTLLCEGLVGGTLSGVRSCRLGFKQDLLTATKPIKLGPIHKVRAGSCRLLLYGTAGRSECE